MPQYPDSWKYIDGGWVRPRSAQPEEMSVSKPPKPVTRKSLIEGSNVQAASRPVSVGGIGLGSGNVWFSSYGGETWGETHNTGIFRFYVNGELKQVLTDYYITDLASLGAVSGDVVQICQVVEGVVGWWSHAEVS